MSQQSEDDRFELFGVEVIPLLVARAQCRRLHVDRLASDLGRNESLMRTLRIEIGLPYIFELNIFRLYLEVCEKHLADDALYLFELADQMAECMDSVQVDR